MKKLFLFGLSLLIVLSFLSSCIVAVVDYSERLANRPIEEFHKVFSFNSGGTLSLENINGDIEILGWNRNEVEVSAEKMIHAYGRRIQWQPIGSSSTSIDFDKFEDFIRIKTRPGGWDKEGAAVNYYLNVPQSIKLKDIVGRRGNISISDFYGEAVIDLVSGEIKVENFSGSLTASVVNGSVKASLYDLRADDEIRITAKEGDIVVYLQPGVDARIEMSTPNGDIFSEFDLKETLPAKKISAQIGGKDGALLSLSSLNGDIRIKKL